MSKIKKVHVTFEFDEGPSVEKVEQYPIDNSLRDRLAADLKQKVNEIEWNFVESNHKPKSDMTSFRDLANKVIQEFTKEYAVTDFTVDEAFAEGTTKLIIVYESPMFSTDRPNGFVLEKLAKTLGEEFKKFFKAFITETEVFPMSHHPEIIIIRILYKQ